MKYVIDDKVCEKHGMTLGEVLTFLLLGTKTDFEESIDKLVKKGIIVKQDTLLGPEYLPSASKIVEIQNILIESTRANPDVDEKRIENLAKEMMKIFPTGRMIANGKGYYWRCNLKENMNHLKRFFMKYGFNTYTDEQILEATKKFVIPEPSKTLKYFIIKNVEDRDEEGKIFIREVSDLATLLDNPESISFEDDGWQNRVI